MSARGPHGPHCGRMIAALLIFCTFAASVSAQTKRIAEGIVGCTAYRQDGKCRECEQPAYQLVKGGCKCADGYRKSGDDSVCKPGLCYQRCGESFIKQGDGFCHCDYWCDNREDCCDGAASKNALCPNMRPTRNKKQLTNCDGSVNKRLNGVAASYLPGMCWCDEHCPNANDCCPRCATCKKAAAKRPQATVGISSTQPGKTATEDEDVAVSIAAVAADSSSALGKKVAAIAAATAAVKPADDCGAHSPYPLPHIHSAGGHDAVGIAALPETQLAAERQMQACQAKDKGPPASPINIPVHWTAGQVCTSGGCTGGKYRAGIVRQQMEYVNKLYAHIGIHFTWDGVIHKATAEDPMEIDVCTDSSGSCWICKQQRFGDQVAVNVMTSPTHVGGTSLGVTLYPSYMATGQMPACANYVFIYEKTLPNLGGRSLVDGGLADGGATLAHEIGHQMLHHTWFEEQSWTKPSLKTQCQGSASLNPADIISGRSDGVRDTPAQSLNATDTVTDILRFVNCDPATGAYTNTTAYAQASCTSAVGFTQGDKYFNNYNNLMSYGDRTCLRTLTPGQGARARCAIKCMRQMAC